MLPIDHREQISLRREEADICIHFGLYIAATLTTCNAIELLLEMLFFELKEKLHADDPRFANELQNYLDESKENEEPVNEWGLGKWISFYEKFNIFAELRSHFGYRFVTFGPKTLGNVNDVWNRYKHSFIEPSPVIALEVSNSLNAYLEEVRHPLDDDSSEPRTVSEFSKHWLSEWEFEIKRWYVQNRASIQARILQNLAKLLAVVVSMIHDKQVTYQCKTQLMIAANYVFSSVDLMPEDKLDVRGLVDDAAVLALTLYWLLRHRDMDADLIRRHWQGDSDIVSEIDSLERYIRENSEKLFTTSHRQFGSNLVWATIRKVAIDGPEALWQNYWKDSY